MKIWVSNMIGDMFYKVVEGTSIRKGDFLKIDVSKQTIRLSKEGEQANATAGEDLTTPIVAQCPFGEKVYNWEN